MIRKGLLIGACLMFALPAMAATRAVTSGDANARIIKVATRSNATVQQSVTLGMGKSAMVELDSEARDVMVSSPDIVDAVVRSPKRIFLLGMKTGQTNVFISDGSGRQILSLDIRVEKDVTDLASLMKANLPNASIKVSAMNDNVVLTGTVASASESTAAAAMAASFTADPKKVVNLLGIASGEQVMLKVRIAEMNRNVAKQFGINASGAFKTGGVPIFAATSNPYGLLGRALDDASGIVAGQACPQQFFPTGSSGSSTTVTNGVTQAITSATSSVPCAGNNNAQGILNALESVGLVHMLAEPNLTAVSGETARFLAGGEFPIPVSRDRDGNITVDYKQFGVGLSFTPVVLSSGRISLQISTEVSEITSAGAYQIGSGTSALTVPALAVRRASTTVELPSGGTFAIAGLMQHNTKQVIEGLPGAKDMPVLGALFRSRDFQNDETELVVLASVYIAEPTTESAFATPTQGFVAPSDPETLLLGRLNSVYKNDQKPLTPEAKAPVGFVVR